MEACHPIPPPPWRVRCASSFAVRGLATVCWTSSVGAPKIWLQLDLCGLCDQHEERGAERGRGALEGVAYGSPCLAWGESRREGGRKWGGVGERTVGLLSPPFRPTPRPAVGRFSRGEEGEEPDGSGPRVEAGVREQGEERWEGWQSSGAGGAAKLLEIRGRGRVRRRQGEEEIKERRLTSGSHQRVFVIE